MINIDVRNKNTLTVLSSPGKTPIITSAGSSPSFYNSMELLCMAYASCFAKHFNRWCIYNNINPETFQNLQVDMDGRVINLFIQHPRSLRDTQIQDLRQLALTCDLYKDFLKCEVKVNLIFNEEKFVEKEKQTSTCCNG